MAYFAGLRGTGSFGTSERPQDFREMILWNAPNGTAPLFALSARMAKKEPCKDPQIHWWEETNGIARATVNGAITDTTTTTVTVDAASGITSNGGLQFAPGDLLMVEQDVTAYDPEFLKVVSVTNDTTIVVTRGAASSTAAAIADDAGLLRVGSAHEEGSTSPTTVSRNPTKFTNYTQIFKTPYQVTRTAQNTYFRTGDALKNDQIRKSFVHSEKIEQALFWGIASENTGSGGQPERTMAGLRSLITTNRYVYSADPTIDDLITRLGAVFDYESGGAGDQRIIYAGNGAINFFNKLVASDSSTRVNYDGVITAYGQNMRKFTIPQGSFAIKSHPLFNVHPTYTYSMFVVNPMGLRYRPLANSDTRIQKNIQANDADLRKDQWLTECTLELNYESSFAYLGGVYDHP